LQRTDLTKSSPQRRAAGIDSNLITSSPASTAGARRIEAKRTRQHSNHAFKPRARIVANKNCRQFGLTPRKTGSGAIRPANWFSVTVNGV